MPPVQRAMRRSCQFCRSRKIRCSGQDKCDACRERNIDCIYGREASKGRPRRPKSKSGEPGTPGTPSSTSTSGTFSQNALKGALQQPAVEPPSGESGAGPDSPPPASPPVPPEFKCAVMSYEAILSLLTQELVEMLSVKYGRLSCHHLGDTAATFYIKSLASDTTPAMIQEPAAPMRNPIQDFDLHRTLQMIEIWFSVHPLSTIVSKTLLLRQYRSNTHDEMLLSLIIADALYIGDGKVANTQGEAFFNYAISLLHTQPVRKCSLSTAQALTLLGWHELCLAKARRATCFLGYACRIVSKLMTRAAQVPTTGLSRINGIDAGEVEVELMKNIYWIVLAITLWSFMQFDQPFGDLLPSPLSMGFPPVEQSNSIVYKLDLVSGNISTFQRQARMIRELWALSHITSTVGHVYSLFPRNVRTAVDLPSSLCWQARPLQQLRLLSNPRQDITILCGRIREILAEATKQVSPQRVSSPASRATVLSAYHTLIIHLLFPRLDPSTTGLPKGSFMDDPPLTGDILDTFSDAAKALIEISTGFSSDECMVGSDKVLYSTGSSADPGCGMTANMFVLGLDACARTLEVFSGHLRSSPSPSERAMLMARKLEFAMLTKELHNITKIERLNIARRIRLVKKHFKMVRVQLEQSLDIDMNEAPTSPAPGRLTTSAGTPSTVSGSSEVSGPNSASMMNTLIMQRAFEMVPVHMQTPPHHGHPAHPPPGYGHYNHQQLHHHGFAVPYSTGPTSSVSSPELMHQHHAGLLTPHDQFMGAVSGGSSAGSSTGSSGTPSSGVGTPTTSTGGIDTISLGMLTPQSTTMALHQGMYFSSPASTTVGESNGSMDGFAGSLAGMSAAFGYGTTQDESQGMGGRNLKDGEMDFWPGIDDLDGFVG
ncbi:hypothetical protein BDZ91DRAFT_816559 [Kalaharituber pfeilii]|nr:hypothetical protein BDZ91DRAFT_816559 [Kalaharituber pfeilii]